MTFSGFTVLWEPGYPGWFELRTNHFDEAVSFYHAVFSCSFGFAQGNTRKSSFANLQHPDGRASGAGILSGHDVLHRSEASSWSIFIKVNNINEIILDAKALGGSVIAEPTLNFMGWSALLKDPTGAKFKIQQDGR
jgi:predicted enzyme related to lactoylglutathione lyase